MTHTQTQGADGAGTKTAGQMATPRNKWREPDHHPIIGRWHVRHEIEAAADTGYLFGKNFVTLDDALAFCERQKGQCRLLFHVADDRWLRVDRPFQFYFVGDADRTPAPAATPDVPDSVRALSEAHDLLREVRDFLGCRPYSASEAKLFWRIRALIAAQPAGQSEPPALRAVVEVYPDRTDTRLTFGDRIRPEPGVKAVQQAIAALTAEYEARGGCPVVGRHPAGQSAGWDTIIRSLQIELSIAQGANRALKEWIKGYRIDGGFQALGQPPAGPAAGMDGYGSQARPLNPTPNGTRTGAAETGAEEADASVPSHILAMAQAMADGRARAWESMRYGACVPQHHSRSYWVMLAQDAYAALAARPEAPSDAGWKDISTAPKDGTEFAAYENGDVFRCNWQEYDEGEGYVSKGWFDHVGQGLENPTHWCPLDGLPTPASDPAPSGQAEG